MTKKPFELSKQGSINGVPYVETTSDFSFTELWERNRNGKVVDFLRSDNPRDDNLIRIAGQRGHCNLIFVREK